MELVCLTHADIELTEQQQVATLCEQLRPDVVINTAAYLKVDECETSVEKAFLVNAIAVKYLAQHCARSGAVLVHFSTDYVFDGEKSSPYQEDDTTAPLNAYGLSKLAGELFARYCLPQQHIIIRTSGLYGPVGSSGKGGNFVETMLRLAYAGREIRVVADQVFSPTYAPDLAKAVLDLVGGSARGIFHLTNSGETSWHEFARQIFREAGVAPSLAAISAQEYASAARRPAYSVLANSRAAASGMHPLRDWRQGLRDYLKARAS
jgi:dTDP-4-dehydrorhamnose reductase